ncbi:MAG: hypothetical protein WCO30_00025 [bacterium]
MENLTKQQIILLTLLVSFVTSIATGIVTVSLMDQAPKSVTQTINRVVERTIEKITPVPTKTDGGQVTIKETVIVNQDDQIMGAVEKNSKTLVRLYKKTIDGDVFSGLGAWITSSGRLITPAIIELNQDEILVGKTSDNNSYELAVAGVNNGLTAYQVILDKIATSSLPLKFSVANFSAQDIKLGQSVITLSGEKTDYVLSGIVSGFIDKKVSVINTSAATSTASSTDTVTVTDLVPYKFIQTNLSSKDLSSGSLLINLSGEVVGINSRAEEMFVPVGVIKVVQTAVK